MCEYFDLYLHCPRCLKNTPEQNVEVALCQLARHLTANVKRNGGICDDLQTRQLTGVYIEEELCKQCKNSPKSKPKFKDSDTEFRLFFAQLWRQHRETEMHLDKEHGPRKGVRQELEISKDGESMVF